VVVDLVQVDQLQHQQLITVVAVVELVLVQVEPLLLEVLVQEG
jgi:hypothetical protein